MQIEPLVSVIVPIYKVEKYLRQCVGSITDQTYRELEIILVDDGSPDNCGAICDEYAGQDERIRVIHQKNGGLSAARNAGLDIAKGDYIFFVDSDDWIASDTIQKMLAKYEETNADLVLCDICPFYEADYSGVKKQASPLKAEVLGQKELIERLMQEAAWYYCVAVNKLYRKELLNKIRFPNGFIHEDEAIAHRIFEKCQTIAVIAEPMYYYRQTNGGIMASGVTIRSTDVLTAIADRLSCARANRWQNYESQLVQYYEEKFWEWYHLFSEDKGNDKYIKRMEKSLSKALPSILNCDQIAVSHKLYLTLLRFSPKLFWAVYNSIRRIKIRGTRYERE